MYNTYSGKVFGSRETSFTGEGPQHTGGCGDDAYAGKELGDDDNTSLDSLVPKISLGL